MWSPEDLRFLLEARQNAACGAAYGATYPRGRHPPVPPVRERSGAPVGLPTPAPLDCPLGGALTMRRTRRERGVLTLAAVSTLLWHTLRVQRVVEGVPYASVFKAVPSGGAMHPCEAYLFASEVEGLAAGVYRYAAAVHDLDAVAPMDGRAYGILEDAARSMGTEAHPPAVIVLAARAGRTAWKYERIPLAAVLRDTGAAYALMSLVGSQCGAGVCPLGGGDMDLFAAVTGLDPMEECSVGELALWGA